MALLDKILPIVVVDPTQTSGLDGTAIVLQDEPDGWTFRLNGKPVVPYEKIFHRSDLANNERFRLHFDGDPRIPNSFDGVVVVCNEDGNVLSLEERNGLATRGNGLYFHPDGYLARIEKVTNVGIPSSPEYVAVNIDFFPNGTIKQQKVSLPKPENQQVDCVVRFNKEGKIIFLDMGAESPYSSALGTAEAVVEEQFNFLDPASWPVLSGQVTIRATRDNAIEILSSLHSNGQLADDLKVRIILPPDTPNLDSTDEALRDLASVLKIDEVTFVEDIGRTESALVKEYLEMLRSFDASEVPRVSRNMDMLKEARNDLNYRHKGLSTAAYNERKTINGQIARIVSEIELLTLELDAVPHLFEWAYENDITIESLVDAGVPEDVLKQAGFDFSVEPNTGGDYSKADFATMVAIYVSICYAEPLMKRSIEELEDQIKSLEQEIGQTADVIEELKLVQDLAKAREVLGVKTGFVRSAKEDSEADITRFELLYSETILPSDMQAAGLRQPTR